jgi:hypothetical protein
VADRTAQALQYNPWRKRVIPTYECLMFCNFFETVEDVFRRIFTAAGWPTSK